MPRPTNDELDEKAQLAEQGLKRCRNCREVLPLGNFGVLARASDGRQPWCKPCTNARMQQYENEFRERNPEEYLARKRAEKARYKERHPEQHSRNIRSNNLRKYGLTIETFEAMHQAQGGKCAICQTQLGEGRRLHVDHCHKTGAVRALLCDKCNVGLGSFKDSPELLRSAARYIEMYSTNDPRPI